jgi:hypothetical protein
VKAERTADALAACEVSSVSRLFNLVEDPNLGNVDMLWKGPVARYSARQDDQHSSRRIKHVLRVSLDICRSKHATRPIRHFSL